MLGSVITQLRAPSEDDLKVDLSLTVGGQHMTLRIAVNEEQRRAVAALLESDLRTRGLDALVGEAFEHGNTSDRFDRPSLPISKARSNGGDRVDAVVNSLRPRPSKLSSHFYQTDSSPRKWKFGLNGASNSNALRSRRLDTSPP